MSKTTTSFDGHVIEEATNMGEALNDSATQIKNKAREMGSAALNKFDESREAAAGSLKTTADSLHENAGTISGGDKLTGLAHSAADVLGSTADYMRDHDANRMLADVKHLVKRNPGPSLIAAAVVGFLIGRAFTRNNS